MEEAHRAAQAGAAHGTAIVAERQTMGRGTRGRAWSSEPGGLWLSVIARPTRADAVEALSLRVGLAVAGALEAACPALPRLAIKWPNDLVVDDRKLAGILCEARWGGCRCLWVVVGVGINVCNEIPGPTGERAVTLARWDPGLTPDALARPIAAVTALAAREAGPLTDAELRAFSLRDALSGSRISSPIIGSAEGITPGGALRVRTDGGPIAEVIAGVVAPSP